MVVPSVVKRKSKKVETNESCFSNALLFKILCAIIVSVFILLWSSSSSVISGNVIRFCLPSRKLDKFHCLSPGAHLDSGVPSPGINNSINATEEGNASVVHDDPNAFVSADVTYNDDADENSDSKVIELVSMQRSWKSNRNDANCDGRGIYIYDLPTKFNKDLAKYCGEMLPWTNFCKYLDNEGYGEAIPELGEGWFNTHQYSLEQVFHARVSRHPCRVYNEDEAKLFYVPFFGGLDILRWHFQNASNDVKDALSLELMTWLETKKPWIQNSGKDHVFVLGKITWDFRRRSSPWGSRWLELDQMQNPIKLLIERHPWQVNDIGIPHPTFFHPRSDDDIINWQVKVIRSKRKSLVSFAGGPRPNAPENTRSILFEQCKASSDNNACRILDCSLGGCDHPKPVIEMFMESEFCLQPPGDSATRKSVFDSLIAGCIPVIFDPFTAYYQYPWHLPEDHRDYSVFIDKNKLSGGKVNVISRLMKVSQVERETMRRYIIFQLLPGLLYGTPDSQLEKFQDAFSITINSLLDRVNKLD